LDLDAKRAFLLKIRANIQYGYRKNFANALRLAAYESDPDDADIRAMLALQVRNICQQMPWQRIPVTLYLLI
jgi:hypothetical protein